MEGVSWSDGGGVSVAVMLQTRWGGGGRVNLGFDQGYYKNGGGLFVEWAWVMMGQGDIRWAWHCWVIKKSGPGFGFGLV